MFLTNLLNSIYTQNPLRSEPQNLAPISISQTNIQNPSTVYRERAKNPSGQSRISQFSATSRLYSGDEEIKTWKQLLGLQEQNLFMKRACSSGLILKTFARVNFPTNLCFKWQEEELRKQVIEVNQLQIRVNNHKWQHLPLEKRKYLRKWKSKKKKHLIKKFMKLKNHHQNWKKVKFNSQKALRSTTL